MTLKDIVTGIEIRTEWQERYKKFIPLFINSAINKENWEDWDRDLFYEFFERSSNQCVSSLQQGYFSKNEIKDIKNNWQDLSPKLKQLAESQTIPNWELYDEISKFIRQFTDQNKQAATNRLIASLQPQLLCTIVANDYLNELYKKLNFVITDGSLPTFDKNNWFKSSYSILSYFKDKLNIQDGYDVITYPWQLKDEWSPIGYNPFYDVLCEIKNNIEKNQYPFKIHNFHQRSNFVWLSDLDNIIGNKIAHYEFIIVKKVIYVDIHFENKSTNDLFYRNITKLPQDVMWIPWDNFKSLRHQQSFRIDEEDLAEKIIKTLLKLDSTVGDQVRNIITNNITSNNNPLMHQFMEEIKLLEYKKQIILQGPPGTGKTRLAKQIAKEVLGFNSNDNFKSCNQLKIIQFHPSYTYEDFVRGIVSKPNEEGDGIIYEAENKILANLAEKALDNYEASKKEVDDIVEKDVFEAFIESIKEEIGQSENHKYPLTDNVYLFYADEIRFKYKGDNWVAHQKGLNMKFSELKKVLDSGASKRQDIKDLEGVEVLTKQHSTYYIKVIEKYLEFKKKFDFKNVPHKKVELKNYVLIIDEINRANLSSVLGELIYALEYRGEELGGMYDIDKSDKLVLPPNLYIIGTMNTADRSVGHIDYAIRRRFAFVDVLPKELNEDDEIYFNSVDYNKVLSLFNEKNVSKEFEINDVQIGHSYFIAKKEDATDTVKRDEIFKMKMNYEVVPILLEYVKDGIFIGEIDGEPIEDYIKSLKIK